MSTYDEDARVFKALCDPKRLAILEQLRSGEKCACVLQGPMDLTQSGLSYHMKILCDSGLVTSRQEGKWTHYRLSREGRERAVKRLLAITTPELEDDTPTGGR
ncbi:MAG TPA: helix-turn-helix transcriptional regulator [Candidatus Fimadaptatus faecigallinarum]|uniref:Helix-turn-helix transcriptional regulator n=1 Tax=Candidatus Fimadaptatus faecigallinarum TaxID=2840814 RepID=A0A9D1S416_9FIRM|nr:helix-turn-helix transcriptional regulator [Candidatus Fimadaptatus faecigallinarum]